MALQRTLRQDDTERRRLFEVWKRMAAAGRGAQVVVNDLGGAADDSGRSSSMADQT